MKTSNPKKVHCIGIGGIGISALARHYLHEGWQVQGSDLARTRNSEKLEAEGVTVFYEQSSANIVADIDLIVYSDGVTKETAGWDELSAARASGIKTISYFEALSEIANEFYLIVVSGTHGKTTTTAMLADIFEEASFDPTVVVGSLRSKTGSNYRSGRSKYFIVEADEYLRHFLYFTPDVVVINNIDFDHPDYFSDLTDVQAAFTELVAKVPESGFIIANTKDINVAPVLKDAAATVVDYTKYLNLTRSLRQPGLHNRLNAAAAEAVAHTVGIDLGDIDTALINFAGTARRFEFKGEVNNALVYDDYAHNPQKVAAAIAGMRELHPKAKLTVVFQPHTYTRTAELFTDFIEALSSADRVVLVPIYAAREDNMSGVSSEQIVNELQVRGVVAEYFHTLGAAALAVRESVQKNDVVLVMGAGDVTKIATDLTTR
jgi:UDP-N-acetylmuramate--alanine ligase